MRLFIQIFSTFFKLGLIAFGGPAMHIALMEREIVEKRQWLSGEKFIDYMGLTALIPGPNSTEMVMCCGLEKGKRPGVFAAGMGFIIPAVAITLVFSWLYVEYGNLPEFQSVYDGIKPAVMALIAVALTKLWKKAVKGSTELIFALITLGLCFWEALALPEVIILLIVGALGIMWHYFKDKAALSVLPLVTLLSSDYSFSQASGKVFLIFFKVGAILYGSGYVLFAYLEGELVETGMLTMDQLMDSVAVGQFTPGPVLSTATFIGYVLDGFSGAFLATLGVFLPSFLFVVLLHPFLDKLKTIDWFRAFLTAVSAAAVALMAYVLFTMSYETVKDGWLQGVLALAYLGVFLKFKKINPAFVIIFAGILGWVISSTAS